MVEFNQAKLATAVLPIDQSNADDMRALRALAWAHHKGSWVEVPDGEKLQRLAETQDRALGRARSAPRCCRPSAPTKTLNWSAWRRLS